MRKRFYGYLSALIALLGTVLVINGFSATSQAANIDNSPDCDTVAIIKCGSYSKQELLKDYDANGYGDVGKVFGAFGISRSDIANGSFVEGVVWRDGRVTVGGKTVATGAVTAGRWNNPTSDMTRISGTSRAYKMSTKHFTSEGQTAMVRMVNGKFAFAILKPCGNPVTATPPKNPQPKPEYACVRLTAEKISRTKYRFVAKATGKNGAEIQRYEFGFGDGYGITVKENTYTYTYKKPGTYKTSVVVHVKVNGKIVETTAKTCKVNVTVKDKPQQPEEPEECKPGIPVGDERCEEQPVTETPEETPPTIAETGPAEVMGGLAGIGGLTAAGYHWRASRRNLIDRLLNR